MTISLDTPTLNRYIKYLTRQGHTAKAQHHRRILYCAFQVAIRDGAITTNPMDHVIRPYRRHDTEPHTVPAPTLTAFRNHVIDSLHAQPRRSPHLLCAAQLLDETGVRTAELLGLRLPDAEVDDAEPCPGIWVHGQLVDSHLLPTEHPLHNHGGWVWVPWTKTGQRGIRRLALAPSGTHLVRQLVANYIPNEFQLLLPTRNGRPWHPTNFRRSWRSAAGKDYTGITPKTFRQRVATDLREAEGITAAAEQLGNSPHIAETYYAARNHHVDHSRSLANRHRTYPTLTTQPAPAYMTNLPHLPTRDAG